MEFTRERKNSINYVIRYFNSLAGSVFKFSTESNQIAVDRALTAAGNDISVLCSYIRHAIKEDGKTRLRVVCNEYACEHPAPAPAPAPAVETPAPTPAPTPASAFTEQTALNFLGGVVTNMLSSMKLDEIRGQVADSLKDEVKRFIYETYGPITRKVEWQIGERKTEVKGVQHKEFETVLAFVQRNIPVFLTGPAGSGKNVICQQVAEVLGLPFYFTNAVTQEYKLTGFTDANGKYQETQFYKAFKDGGVFMLDEMDASIPDVLIILNSALSNHYFDFPAPIGFVKQHPDFRVIAAGNTFGQGATMEYVGRNQIDEATLDRFAPVRIDYDPNIEEVCANGDQDLLKFIRAYRKATQASGIKTIVSYRSITRIATMIDCLDIKKVLDSCLLKSMGDDDLKMMQNKVQGCGKYTEAYNAIVKMGQRG